MRPEFSRATRESIGLARCAASTIDSCSVSRISLRNLQRAPARPDQRSEMQAMNFLEAAFRRESAPCRPARGVRIELVRIALAQAGASLGVATATLSPLRYSKTWRRATRRCQRLQRGEQAFRWEFFSFVSTDAAASAKVKQEADHSGNETG